MRLVLCARVVWVFGGTVEGPIEDITPTCLTHTTLSTLREADSRANSVLLKHGNIFSYKLVYVKRIFL